MICNWSNSDDLNIWICGTVGGPEKAEAAKKAGYHHVIDYNDKDFVAEVMNLFSNAVTRYMGLLLGDNLLGRSVGSWYR